MVGTMMLQHMQEETDSLRGHLQYSLSEKQEASPLHREFPKTISVFLLSYGTVTIIILGLKRITAFLQSNPVIYQLKKLRLSSMNFLFQSYLQFDRERGNGMHASDI